MKINKFKLYYRTIFIYFIFLFLIIFFFSTGNAKAKSFEINNVEISKPFEMGFNKNRVIDEGFKKAFNELILLIVNSLDQKKIKDTKLNEIKFMIESFSIKEEKFVNEIYYLNFGVSFNRKKVFKFLENKNIFPSIPNKNKLLYLPIVIEEDKKNLFIFTNNIIFKEWNSFNESHHLIEYVLPTEDLEDLEIIKKRYEFIEQYDFKDIISKYDLEDAIISLIFKNKNKIRVLSRITFRNDVFLKNTSFVNLNLNNQIDLNQIIKELKINFEDHWKSVNQINTSIKLPLKIKIKNKNEKKISNFEKILEDTDLIYDFFINKFDNNFIVYEIIYNGTPNIFLESMSEKNLNFDIQDKNWILK
tara:strand:+ start:13488 stop:14567 length:1080 start_codon:yes stop_codon:yes gene_type:complete